MKELETTKNLPSDEMKITGLKNILLKVLSEGGSTLQNINAEQHFSVSADFLEKAEKTGGAVIINNYQSQSISVENKKQLVNAIKMLESTEKEIVKIKHDQTQAGMVIQEEKRLLAIREAKGLYDRIFDEIEDLGSIEAFYQKTINEMAGYFNDNRTHLAKFLNLSVRTIRNRIGGK